MAFVDFRPDAWIIDPMVAPRSDLTPARDAAEPFTPLERTVVSLSLCERASSLRTPGRFGVRLARLFALRRANPLADPRLEALRRFAVAARLRTGRALARERTAFLGHGFSSSQADRVRLAVST